MAVQSRKNQYRGINAHLHSFFQTEDGWKSLHNAHITELARALADALPDGYTVDIELSLQMEITWSGHTHRERPYLDIAIFGVQAKRDSKPSTSAGQPTASLPITATLQPAEEKYQVALMVYRGNLFGKPVTRIEVLSPTNKKGEGLEQYLDKREIALRSGLPLVELDYLHQTPPPIKGIPDYRQAEVGSHPYMIIVSDPRPTLSEGKTDVYGFDADDPIPFVPIPLDDEEVLLFDFGTVYHHTFESLPAYGLRVDYSQVPMKFNTYSAADQERIYQRMQIACEALSK